MKDDSKISKVYEQVLKDGILANMGAQAQHFGPEDIVSKSKEVIPSSTLEPGIQGALEEIIRKHIGVSFNDPKIKRIHDALLAAVELGKNLSNNLGKKLNNPLEDPYDTPQFRDHDFDSEQMRRAEGGYGENVKVEKLLMEQDESPRRYSRMSSHQKQSDKVQIPKRSELKHLNPFEEISALDTYLNGQTMGELADQIEEGANRLAGLVPRNDQPNDKKLLTLKHKFYEVMAPLDTLGEHFG